LQQELIVRAGKPHVVFVVESQPILAAHVKRQARGQADSLEAVERIA